MKYPLITPLILVASLYTASLQAAEVPKDSKQQTTWGLYVDSNEVAEMKKKLGDKMLFIDVRDPVEIMFTGFTDLVDVNIPFKTADRSTWHNKKPVFNMKVNKSFEKDIKKALTARGLSKEAPIAIMCRSGGTRGAPATKLLENKGYKNIYVVTDGFEGGKVKGGDKKNWRLKNGWKNAGLPWGYKLNKEKMYFAKPSKKSASITKLNHANPMPNYLPVVMKNAKTLNLTTEQKGKLKAWSAENKEKANAAVNKIVDLESSIATASMQGDSKETLLKQLTKMSSLRLKLATAKTACRDNLRTVLSEKQWNQLVKIQKGTYKKS